MKMFFRFIKRIIISSFLLYIFNYFAVMYDFIVPINVFTILFTSLFGVYGFIGLVLFKYFIMWGFYGWDFEY